MTSYLLTIITVTFNASSTIKKTLQSLDNLPKLAGQRRYLHVVIDGLSSDNTFDIVQGWNYRYDFDKLIYSESDNGLYDAMNKGLSVVRNSDTRWFTFLNADDVFCSLDVHFLDLLNHHHRDAVAFSSIFDFTSGPVVVNPLLKCRPNMSHLGIPLMHQATIYNSRIAKSAFFDLRLKLAADYLFMIQYIDIKNVTFSSIALTIYDCNGLSSSVSALTLKLEYIKALLISRKPILLKFIGFFYQLSVGVLYDLKRFFIKQ